MNFHVAIPDSSLSDEQTVRDKSIKIAQFARAFSIFRTSKVYIYRDHEKDYIDDRRLLKLILEFLDTPPYLRKILYPMREELRFAGLLHPLKTPHHKPSVDPSKIRVGDVRQAAVVGSKGRVLVDAGLKSLIPLEGDVPKERRITVQFTSNHPNFRCKAIAKEHVKEYWGYEVKEVQSLVGLLESAKNPVILTSREGEPLGKREREIIQELKNSSGALIVFGSPNRGLREILKDERRMVADFKYFLNFVPSQGTETVRLEESVLGCLSILNYLTSTNRTL